MSYLFTCPHCQTRTLVDDRFSGHSGQCVTCASPIQLPDFAPSASGASAGSPTATAASGNTSAMRSGRFNPLRRQIAAAVVCLAVIGCAAVFVLRYVSPTMITMQNNRQRAQSIRSIEKIAAALNAYAADHGTYPPPRINGPDGRPMHSWRVLILPYLGEQELFNQYDFDLPWDAPSNAELAYTIPNAYRSVGSGGFGTEAGYSLITGPGTLFPPAPPRGFRALGPRDVVDDPGQTLLVVESVPLANSFMSWTEPADLDAAVMQGVIGGSPGREIGGTSQGGAVVATVDGRGHFLSDQTSALTVMALITIAGGEPLPSDVLDR
jgi:hypothetical protein